MMKSVLWSKRYLREAGCDYVLQRHMSLCLDGTFKLIQGYFVSRNKIIDCGNSDGEPIDWEKAQDTYMSQVPLSEFLDKAEFRCVITPFGAAYSDIRLACLELGFSDSTALIKSPLLDSDSYSNTYYLLGEERANPCLWLNRQVIEVAKIEVLYEPKGNTHLVAHLKVADIEEVFYLGLNHRTLCQLSEDWILRLHQQVHKWWSKTFRNKVETLAFNPEANTIYPSDTELAELSLDFGGDLDNALYRYFTSSCYYKDRIEKFPHIKHFLASHRGLDRPPNRHRNFSALLPG